MKKKNYASMFTRRADGRYMGYWHELDKNGQPTGARHAIYDRDPETLYKKIIGKETPKLRTLRVVAGEWEAQHRDAVTPRTWANYKKHLGEIVAYYGSTPIDELSAADVNQDLLSAKARGYSHTVVNTRRSLWRMIFDYAIGLRDVPYNPALAVKNPKGLQKGKRSAPTDEQLAVILDGAGSTEFDFIPFFLLCTGVRRSEALHRRKADLDLDAWELHIPKSKTAAGVRTVPLIEPLRVPLLAWIAAHPGEWLFPHVDYYAGRKGGPGYMSDTNWNTAWLAYCAAHGWTDSEGKPTLGAHNLRHGTATLLYEAEVDVYTAQHILGHASVTTTLAIYTELRKKHERKNVDKFSAELSRMLSKSKKAAD